MTESSFARKLIYAISSAALGAWTFVTINGISGPAFEPIIAACTNPDYKSMDDFVSQSGYHEYDVYVGLKAFDVLVCLITQFLFELRQTYPAGVLVWCAIIVVSLPTTILWTVEAGRSNARGLVGYPVVTGMLGQLFGISVIAPLVWLPALVYGEGDRGSPLTSFRIKTCGLMVLPTSLLTATVFLADTDSKLWTAAAGMLGGPILALTGLVLVGDKSELEATKENKTATRVAIQDVYKKIMYLGLLGWYILVAIAYQAYGFSFSGLWDDIWVNANASVAFMTIDTVVLYVSVLQYLAYRGGEFMAVKALGLTVFMGPAAAASVILSEIEDETDTALEADAKKKD